MHAVCMQSSQQQHACKSEVPIHIWAPKRAESFDRGIGPRLLRLRINSKAEILDKLADGRGDHLMH